MADLGGRLSARRALRSAACSLGLDHAARNVFRRRLAIVMYHGVRADDDPARDWMLLPRSEFERQLRYLRAHYHVAPIDEAVAALRDGGLARPTVCVTFDDGYRNNATVAFPVLRELHVPATIYLATGLIGTGERIWTTRVVDLVARATVDRVDATRIGLGVLPTGSAAERAATGVAIRERFKDLPRDERLRAEAALRGQLGIGPDADLAASDGDGLALMDWDEARELEASGLVTFGAHTVRHEIVSLLEGAELEEEIAESIREVARRLRAPSSTFAYPNGRAQDFDWRAARAVRDAGARAALTTIEGLNTTRTDPYALHRISVGSEMTFEDFRLRVSGLVAAVTFSRPELP